MTPASFGVPSDAAGFDQKFGWTAAPSLTHPIIYAVSGKTEHPELAARLLAFASDADLNTDHAVTTTHIGIKPSQVEDPRYAENWPLARATKLLEHTKFIPNNPDFGPLNRILFQAMQGVELGQLDAAAAAEFVVDEAQSQIDNIIVR